MRPGQGGADAGTRTPNLPLTRFTLCRSHGVPGRPCAGQGYGGHIGGESERPRTETPFEPPCQGDLARREQGGPLFPLRDHVMVGGTCPGSPAPPHVRGVGWRCMLSVSPGPDPLTARHSPRAAVVRLPGRTLRILCAAVRVGPAVVAAVVTQLDTHRRPGRPQWTLPRPGHFRNHGEPVRHLLDLAKP